MIRKFFVVGAVMLVAPVLLTVASCGRSQRLESISLQPNSVTFLSPDTNITFQLKAYGTYIHPPETKDITSQVKWQSLSTDLVLVSPTGVVSTAQSGHCGITDVTATAAPGGASGNVVVASATMTVKDTTTPVCP
jgi:hypothetical protein